MVPRIIKNKYLFFSGSLVLFAFIFVFSCRVDDDELKESDAYNQIYYAVEYKAEVCGNRPGYLLILPGDVSSYATDLCSLSIVRMDCPFNDYPTECLGIYLGLETPQ